MAADWGGGVRGKSGLPEALQDFPLGWRSFSPALHALLIVSFSSMAVDMDMYKVCRPCLSSGGSHPILSCPIPLEPSPAYSIPSHPIQAQPSPAAGPQDPALPSPRSAALSLLRWQPAPSREEGRGDGCGSQERSAS